MNQKKKEWITRWINQWYIRYLLLNGSKMNEEKNNLKYELKDAKGWMNRHMKGWKDEWKEGWIYEWMNGWMN